MTRRTSVLAVAAATALALAACSEDEAEPQGPAEDEAPEEQTETEEVPEEAPEEAPEEQPATEDDLAEQAEELLSRAGATDLSGLDAIFQDPTPEDVELVETRLAESGVMELMHDPGLEGQERQYMLAGPMVIGLAFQTYGDDALLIDPEYVRVDGEEALVLVLPDESFLVGEGLMEEGGDLEAAWHEHPDQIVALDYVQVDGEWLVDGETFTAWEDGPGQAGAERAAEFGIGQ